MKIRTLASLAVLTASSLASTNASAQTHTDSFTYQGSLMDGGVRADGFYDFTFFVYDSEVGGALIPGGTIFLFNIEVVDGLFEAFVQFGGTGSVFDSDQTRWLQLSVKEVGTTGFTFLVPRQRIAPAPLANYALRSGTSLQDAYDSGPTIFRGIGDPAVEIRSSGTSPARLNLGSTSGTEPEGQFFVYGSSGDYVFFVEQDLNTGGGGFLRVTRKDNAISGFTVDGNSFGTESTEVKIEGVSSSIVLSTRLTDDLSVQLPNDAINAAEILNETGVAEASNSGSVTLTQNLATIDVVASVTIDCPTAGYVFVIASAELSIDHLTATDSSVDLGVSDNTNSIPSNGDLETRIDLNTAEGTYDHAVTVHSVFPAIAGSNTFYFLGNQNHFGASSRVLNTQLSAIFIPTAYGSVALGGGASTPDEHTPLSGPMTQYDIVMEQNAAIIANNERLEREMDAMKTQMQEILEQSKHTIDQQSQD